MILSLLYASGCHSISSTPDLVFTGGSTFEHLWTPPGPKQDERFRNAGKILTGFDSFADDASFEPNDRVLLSVELQQNGRRDLWFVRIEVEREQMMNPRPTSSSLSSSATPVESSANSDPVDVEDESSAEIGADNLDSGTPFRLVQTGTIRFDDGTEMHINSPMLFVKVSVFDADAKFLGSSVSLVPETVFTSGPFESCRYLDELEVKGGFEVDHDRVTEYLSEDERRQFGESVGAGILSMLSFFETIQENDALVALRSSAWNEIAKHPSLWSIATNLGIRLSIEPQFHRAEYGYIDWPGEPEPVPAFVYPTIARANGEEAVRCRIVAVRPHAPAHLCAGMVFLEASHPDKPENCMRVQVIAARRGGEDATVKNDAPKTN